MELRHLRYFVAVAEELNFTRAAKRLNIAQPPLTQQIKALEAEIGVELFDRSGYRIRLTEPGQILLAEARIVLGQAAKAVLSARQAGRGQVGSIRVGFTESACFNPLVPAAIRACRTRYPEIDLALEEGQSTSLANALREGRLDVAFVRPPLLQNEGDLVLQELTEEEMVVVLPTSHGLARRSSVALSELAEELFILYPRTVRPGLADAVMAACERVGFSPRIGQHTPQLSSTINLVAASLGISVVPECMRQLRPDGVKYLKLTGERPRAVLGIAHRQNERSPVVLNFLDIAKSLGADSKTAGTSPAVEKEPA